MPKRKDILDVYRDFKAREPEVAHGFGDAAFVTFYMSDARMVNRVVPDVPVERGARCEIVRVHLSAFPQLFTRGDLGIDPRGGDGV